MVRATSHIHANSCFPIPYPRLPILGYTASDNEVKVKSRIFIGGIIITNGDSSSPTRTGLPISSMLLSMITGDSLKRKFLIGYLISHSRRRRSVAGQTGQQHGLRIYHADIPGAGDQDPFLRRLDEVHRRLVAADHDQVAGLPNRLLLFQLGPVPRILQVLDLALGDDRRAFARQAFLVPRQHADDRVGRVGIDGDPLVIELFAQLVAAALLGQEAATFIGLSRIEAEHHEGDQARTRGRLQDHRVFARFERLGVLRCGGFFHRRLDLGLGIELCTSARLRATQPEPVPSSVRTVQVKSTLLLV